MKTIVIFVLVALVSGCTAIQSGLCEMRDGTAHVNLDGYQYCAKTFGDGGNQCTDSSQCEGLCYLPWDYDPKASQPLVGKCAVSEIEVNQPCYFVENGKAEMGLCIEE